MQHSVDICCRMLRVCRQRVPSPVPVSGDRVHHLTVILSSMRVATPASAYSNLHPADQTTLLQKTADRRVATPLSEERVHQLAVILSSMRG